MMKNFLLGTVFGLAVGALCGTIRTGIILGDALASGDEDERNDIVSRLVEIGTEYRSIVSNHR